MLEIVLSIDVLKIKRTIKDLPLMSKLERLTATFSDVLRDLLPFVQSKNVKNTHGGGFNLQLY